MIIKDVCCHKAKSLQDDNNFLLNRIEQQSNEYKVLFGETVKIDTENLKLKNKIKFLYTLIGLVSVLFFVRLAGVAL